VDEVGTKIKIWFFVLIIFASCSYVMSLYVSVSSFSSEIMFLIFLIAPGYHVFIK
jgi:hypothetical protein